MDTPHTSPIVLKADIEHSGVRILILASFLIGFMVVFLVLSAIFRSFTGSLVSEFYFALSCIVAIPLAIGAAGLSEYLAKRRWPSGRSVELNDEGILATISKDATYRFHWDGHISAVKWYFWLKGYRRGGRERRVPSGWLCVAYQMQQDENRFIVFSYMSEKLASNILDDNRFLELKPADYYRSSVIKKIFSPPSRPDIPTKVLAGKQGHYWLAERRRWTDGMELEVEDFQVFLNVVNQKVNE